MNLRTRLFAGLALVAALAFSSSSLAGEIRSWDAAAFTAAQAADQAVIVHVTAPWCPTCRAQRPLVEALVTAPEHEDTVVFDVDFDSQKDVLRQFGVRQQSTLIAFKGNEEVGRSVGDTRPAGIAALFAATN